MTFGRDRLRLFFVCAAIVVSTLVFVTRVLALELDDGSGLITQTVAARENRRDYDNIKRYGAETISERSREHVQPEGGRIGNFLVFPELESRVIFDDNIFGASRNAVDDILFEVSPEVSVSSQLPRHILNMAVGASLVSYAKNTDQNYSNYFGSIDGGLHIDNAHTLGLSVRSALNHELPGSINSSVDVGEPVAVFHHRVVVGLTRDVGRLYGTLSATAERFDLQDSRAIDGSVLDQDERDTDLFSTQLRAGYRFSPGFEVVGRMRLLRQLHSHGGDSEIDAYGYEGVVGVAFETNPLLRWRLLGGYGLRDFDQPGSESIGTMLLEGNVEWIPTQRITIVGASAREFVDTVGLDQTGRVETSVSARADFEILNNMVLSIGGKAMDAQFNGLDRNDRTYSAYAELQYYLNKHLLLSFGYDHQTRDSNVDAFDMERNRFMIGAKLRY